MIGTHDGAGPDSRSRRPHYFTRQRDTASRNVAFALFYAHGNANRGAAGLLQFLHAQSAGTAHQRARVGRRDSRVPGACGGAAARGVRSRSTYVTTTVLTVCG